MNCRNNLLAGCCLLGVSLGAGAVTGEEITDAVTMAIADMDQLAGDLARCNARVEAYRSSRAMQTGACRFVAMAFENHLASHKNAMDILTRASLDIRVEQARSQWWASQEKLVTRLKNTQALLETDLQRHMELLQKYRIRLKPAH